jgi:5-hydroxyisourate hydrolase-like protein (transthyretin family)
MRSKFVISESDRRNILSMYGVLNEESSKTIKGQVVRFEGLVDPISDTPAAEVKVDLYRINSDSGFEDLEFLKKTETDSNGSFEFSDLVDFNNLMIRVNENDFYNEKEVIVPNKESNEQFIKIQISFKQKKQKPTLEKIKEPCSDYVSDKDTFYGKANSTEFDANQDDDTFHDQVVINAKIDALKQYLTTYGETELTEQELIDKLKNETSIDYKIVCSERKLNENNVSTKYVTVKIKKTDLDNFVKKEIVLTPTKTIEPLKIGFRDLVKKSFNDKKPAMVVVYKNNDPVSEDLLKRLSSIQNIEDKYIFVKYLADESDELGFVMASDTIGLDKIPSLAIIQGSKEPTPIKGSFKTIKLINDFGSYFTNFDDYRTIIDNFI